MIEDYILQTFDGKIVKDNIQIKTCPFCGNPKYNLEISLIELEEYGNKKIYHCWACDASGTLEKFCRLFNIPYIEGEHYKSESKPIKSNICLPSEFKFINNNEPKSIYEQNAVSYLHSRNIKDQTIKRFKIGYCSSGKFECRLVFPIYEYDELVYFTTRGYWYNKHLGSYHPNYEKSGILYNFDYFYEDIVLVEGVFDALSVIQCGHNGVALLGKKIYQKQVGKIFNSNVKNIKILLDSDTSNKDRETIYGMLNIPRLNVEIIKLKNGDPNSISQDELKKHLIA